MKFKTLGNPQNPSALLIHAMFFSVNMFNDVAAILQDSYYVILPVLDDHNADERTAFISASDEAEQIINYLFRNNITEIHILLGNSLGGIIAFELFRKQRLTIYHVFLDGAPFILFSDFRIKIMAEVFKMIAHKSAKYPEKHNILDLLFPSHASEMKKVCGKISDQSIANLARACYTYKLPDTIALSEKQTLTFIYGTREKARMCVPELKKYTNCKILMKEGYTHCGFLSAEPRKYALMLTQADRS